jgi:hypothetical protein
LTESERMQAFYDLVKLQDSVPIDDPEWFDKQELAYSVIAKEYGVTTKEMRNIAWEGITENWPMP